LDHIPDAHASKILPSSLPLCRFAGRYDSSSNSSGKFLRASRMNAAKWAREIDAAKTQKSAGVD
jgi:hypothetical protein